MLEKPLKLIGYLFFLLQFSAIMFYQYYKYFKAIFRRILGSRESAQLPSPLGKVHPHVYSTTGMETVDYAEQIIQLSGYRIDTHDILTEDNYALTVWRLVCLSPKPCGPRPFPVLIMHGLLDCGITWFLHENKYNDHQFRHKNLPYMLANMGFDVWVGNNRGTRYSKKGSDRPGYWNFSFDELAKYDVPALVDNILNLTGRKKLIYVGHSQGSTQLVARLTEDLNFAAKIALNVGLGTVVTLHTYSDDCILRLFEKVPILQLLKWLGFKTMLSIPAWLVRCVAILTYNTKFYPTAGLYVIHFVCGFPKKGQSNIKRDRLGVIFSHEPGGSSINNVIQWYHLFSFRLHTSFEKQLGKFDHGRQQNLKLYGREKPPRYQLENLKDCRFPTLLFRGTIDSVVSETDFEGLAAKFPAELTRSVHIEDYHHLDYVWADSAHSLVYPEILKAAVQVSELQV